MPKTAKTPVPSQVRAQLERLLNSREFARAARLQSFLEFIVEEKLEGRGDGLTEQPIGLQLYTSDGRFDGASNPTVRVDAHRLRSRLVEYYARHPEDTVRITLPKGGYVPEFSFSVDSPGISKSGVTTSAPDRRFIAAAGVAFVTMLGFAAWMLWSNDSPTTDRPGMTARNGEDPTDSARSTLDAVPLTTLVGHELNPAFSPDGSQVVFAHAGDSAAAPDLYIKIVGEEGTMQITDSSDSDLLPAWSPNGRWIAFIRQRDSGDSSVFLVSPLGDDERLILDNVTDVDWTPDSTTLLISGYGQSEQGNSIYSVALDDTNLQRLTQPGTVAVDHFPRVSPSAENFAFVRCNTRARQNCDIYLAPLPGGSGARRLTRIDTPVSGLDWFPGGGSIVFSTAGELRRVGISGAGANEADKLGISGTHPVMTTRGTAVQLAFQVMLADSSIRRVDLMPTPSGAPGAIGAQRRLIRSSRLDFNPVVSTVDETIAFISDRGGSFATWLSDPDGNNVRLLTDKIDGWLSWSPDGTMMAGLCVDEGDDRNDICVVDVATRKVQRIAPSPDYDGMGTWSSDGRAIYFSSTRGGEPAIWKTRPGSEAPARVTDFPAILVMSARGRDELYYIPDPTLSRENWEQELWALDPHTGEKWRVLDRFYLSALSTIRTGLIWLDYSGGTKAPPTVRYRAYDGGDARDLGALPFMPWGRFPEFSVHPEGRYLLIASGERSESDLWLIEDFR